MMQLGVNKMNDYGLFRDRRRRPYPLGHPNRALGLSATCLLVACGGGDGGMMTRSARARRAIASRMRGINTRQDSPSIGASVRAISEGHAEAFSSRCGNELRTASSSSVSEIARHVLRICFPRSPWNQPIGCALILTIFFPVSLYRMLFRQRHAGNAQ